MAARIRAADYVLGTVDCHLGNGVLHRGTGSPSGRAMSSSAVSAPARFRAPGTSSESCSMKIWRNLRRESLLVEVEAADPRRSPGSGWTSLPVTDRRRRRGFADRAEVRNHFSRGLREYADGRSHTVARLYEDIASAHPRNSRNPRLKMSPNQSGDGQLPFWANSSTKL